MFVMIDMTVVQTAYVEVPALCSPCSPPLQALDGAS